MASHKLEVVLEGTQTRLVLLLGKVALVVFRDELVEQLLSLSLAIVCKKLSALVIVASLGPKERENCSEPDASEDY